MIYVIAHGYSMYRLYIRERGLTTENTRYISSNDQLHGLETDIDIRLTNGFGESRGISFRDLHARFTNIKIDYL